MLTSLLPRPPPTFRSRVEFPVGGEFSAVFLLLAARGGARRGPAAAACELQSLDACGPAGKLRSEVKRPTRAQAIDGLRQAMTALTDGGTCMCLAAARLGISRKGFAQWTSYELKERYDWIACNRPGITRRELEDLADRWQLARQQVRGTEFCCDTQTLERHTCKGWDGFSNTQLAEFCDEPVEIA